MGEEPYFIDEITDYIALHALSPEERVFNQLVMYGKDCEAATVIEASRRFPMMANHQVIIVKEAQNIRNIEELVYYSERPLPSTILVINYKFKVLDKRKKLSSSLEKHGVLFHAKKIYEDKVGDWISSYLAQRGSDITPDAARLMAEYLGNDLSKVANELQKLMGIQSSSNKKITTSDIEKNIGFSKDFNVFELQKALVERDVLKANRIIDYFARNEKDNPMVLSIGSLFGFFGKVFKYHFLKDKSQSAVALELGIRPYFVSDYERASKRFNPAKLFEIISLLREYDMKSKGVGNSSATDGDLMKELVYKIIH